MKRFSVVAALALLGCGAPQPPSDSPEPAPPETAEAPAVAEVAPAAGKRVLVQGLAGADAPTRAVLAFVGAFGAAEAGHQVVLVLAGDGAGLVDDATGAATVGQGLGSIVEWWPRIQKHKIPVFV